MTIDRVKSIAALNNAVADELGAVHQYLYFHFHANDQGLDLISKLFHKIAIDEMRHVAEFAERALFLKGEVELVSKKPVIKETDPKRMLQIAREMEEGAIGAYNQMAEEAGQARDSVTKRLFEQVIVDEERHFSLFDAEAINIEKYGDKYLSLQSMERARANAAPRPTEGG